LASQYPIEPGGKLCVSVADQVAGLDFIFSPPHSNVASLLFHPGFIGVVRRGDKKDLPATQVEKEQAIDSAFAQWGPNSFAEEVTRDQGIHVRPDEQLPGGIAGIFLPDWIRADPVLGQHPAYRGLTHRSMQLQQLADDPTVAPSGILLGESNNGIPYILANPGPTHPARMLTVPLFADPTPVGLEGNDADDVFDTMPKPLAEMKQPTAFFGSQYNSVARQPGAEHLVLRFEKPDLSIAA